MDRSRRKHVRRLVSLAVALVLALVVIRLSFPRDHRADFESLRVGSTTEAEVTTMFGPPVSGQVLELSTDDARRRGIPIDPDEVPARFTSKQWWYDDDHVLELEFDEDGILFHVGGPYVTDPRSPIRRWLRKWLE